MVNIIKQFWLNLKKKGAIPIFISTFLVKFATFFASFFLIRIFSKYDYGIFSYFENIYGYLYLIAGLGLSRSIVRFVVIAKDNDKKNKFYQYSIKVGTIINLNIVLIACIVFNKITFPEPYSNYAYIIIILALMLPFKYVVDCNLYLHRAMFKPKNYAFWSIVATFAYVASKIIGAYLIGLKGVVLLGIIAEFALCIFLFFNCKKLYFNKVDNSVKLTKEEKKASTIFAIEDMITNGLWSILMLNDVFILGRFFSDPSVIANYKAAVLVPQMFSLISNSVGLIVGPFFTKLESENKIDDVKKMWLRTLIISTVMLSILFLIAFIFAKPLIILFCGEQYVDIVSLMRLFLISSLINNAFRYTTANILTSMGAVKYNIAVSVIGLVFQITLNIIFIPIFGIRGVAYSNIISYSIMALMVTAFYFRFIKKRVKLSQ